MGCLRCLIRREAIEQPRTAGALKPVLATVARGQTWGLKPMVVGIAVCAARNGFANSCQILSARSAASSRECRALRPLPGAALLLTLRQFIVSSWLK